MADDDLFDTERKPVTLEHNGKSLTFWIRELGYYEFQLMQREAVRANVNDPSMIGFASIRSVILEAVENEDGTKAFTEERLRRLPDGPAQALAKAAMAVQGVDIEKEAEAETLEGSDAEGNG